MILQRQNQKKLPHLPVPDLATETIPMLLRSVRPLARSPSEFEALRAKCEDFLQTQGARADRLLRERAEALRREVDRYRNGESAPVSSLHPDGSPFPNNHFLEATWEAMAYLAWQDSTVCYSNVFTTMFASTGYDDRPGTPYETILNRAALLALGIYDFGRLILNDELKMESEMMCSAQYLRILWTTRLPGEKMDRISTNIMPLTQAENQNTSRNNDPYADRAERTMNHICVSYRGFWYEVELDERTNVAPRHLHEILCAIRADGDARPLTLLNDISYLTGTKRDVWAKNRVALKASSVTSAESLRSIEEAMFHLVLSPEMPRGSEELQRALAEGKGIWYDKSTTIMVFANGTCGANLEHAAADAVVPSRMLVHANEFALVNGGPEVAGSCPVAPYKNASRTPIRDMRAGSTNSVKRPFRFLEFNVDEDFLQSIFDAKNYVYSIFAESLVSTVTVKGIGSNQIKSIGVAPDSFIQLALQLAYARDQDTSVPPATYETASTRQFFHGRTECIRSQSLESAAFVEAMNRNAPPELVRKAVDAAAGAHRNYLTQATNGRGCDRHLLCLRMTIAQEMKDEKMHELYSDELLARGGDFRLSTSQLPWPVPDHPGFGAPLPESYGCCYRFCPDEIVSTVSSRATCKGKHAKRFAMRIEEAVRDLYEALKPTAPAPKAAPKAKL